MDRLLANQLALLKHLYLTHFCLFSGALQVSGLELITYMGLDERKDIKPVTSSQSNQMQTA